MLAQLGSAGDAVYPRENPGLRRHRRLGRPSVTDTYPTLFGPLNWAVFD